MNRLDLAIAALDREWDQDVGFFGRLRQGNFDAIGLERTVGILQSIEIPEDTVTIDRRLVELTWMIPRIMEWQRERVAENGGDVSKLDAAVNRLEGMAQDILGVP